MHLSPTPISDRKLDPTMDPTEEQPHVGTTAKKRMGQCHAGMT